MHPLNIHTLVALGLVFVTASPVSTAKEIPRIILDTDMRGDCDDAGALAALHALADNGECEILGVMASTTGPHVASVIGAINIFYGRPDLPVGLYDGTGIHGDDYYAPVVGDPLWFPSRVSNATAAESTALYRQLLHESPANSVSIVVIGGQPCIHGLLVSEADHEGDGSINMTGKELIATKMRELVLMAGSFDNPNHAEWNVILDIPAARQVAEEWPGRIVFSGFEIGWVINTGGTLEDPQRNPVAKSYELYLHTEGGMGNIGNRASWDQTAVYYAVRGRTHDDKPIWALEGPISVTYTDEGLTRFQDDPNANRYRMIQQMSIEETEALIEALMVQPPRAQVAVTQPAPGTAYAVGERILPQVSLQLQSQEPRPIQDGQSIPDGEITDGALSWQRVDLTKQAGTLDPESAHLGEAITVSQPGTYTIQAHVRLKNGAELFSPLNTFSVVPEASADGANTKNVAVNLALLDTAQLTGSVTPESGRGNPKDILFAPERGGYAVQTDWNEYGVAFREDLGLVTEEEPFYWQVAWEDPRNINEITIGGTYNNQPQPFAQWKVQYRSEGAWHTLQEGQGGWINTGIFHWYGVDDTLVVADAVRVVVFSGGEHSLRSIHLRGRGGVSRNEDDSTTEPKAAIIRYR